MMKFIRKFFGLFGSGAQTTSADDAMAKINQQLEFQQSQLLTIGVECEFGLIDAETCEPVHAALDIVKTLNHPNVHHELYQHMIEITTGVCSNIQQVEKDLSERLAQICAQLPAYKSDIVGVGSLPLLRVEQIKPVETERYAMLRTRRQALYERFTTLGMHIHIGMPDTAGCIRFHNFYMHFLPHLLALSASSPMEEGRDTGFASIRPAVTESMPIGGIPYQFHSWRDYKDLCRAMVRADSITDLKDLWWDLRPCPRYGTLEIRICDQPATLSEVYAIAAFVHCLGHWFVEHQDWLDEIPRPNNWRMRENKWRVMRYGIDADIVMNDSGDKRPIKEDIAIWLERLAPIYDRFGYGAYRDLLQEVLQKGNGSSRQRRVLQATGNMQAVYAHLIAELKAGRPLWDDIAALEQKQAPAKAS